MGTRQFILGNGSVANVPEESIDAWTKRMDERGVSFRDAETPEEVAPVGAPDDGGAEYTPDGQPPANPTPAQPDGDLPKSRAHVGTPEVIKGPTPVDDPDVLTVTETTTPAGTDTKVEASPSTKSKDPWIDALANAYPEDSLDPVGINNPRLPDEEFSPTAWATHGLKGLTSNFVPAAARGFDALSGSHLGTDYVADPLVRATAESERDYPKQSAAADVAGTLLNPATRWASGLTEGMAPGRALVANVASQAAQGAGASAMRQYGDTGEMPEGVGTDAAISALSALPGAAVGATADKAMANASVPEVQEARAAQARNEHLRSAGLDPSVLKGKSPQEQAQILADIKALRANNGDRGAGYVPTVAEMNQRATAAANAAGAQKDAAISALASQGASVPQQNIADNMRQNILPGGSARERINDLVENVASSYEPGMVSQQVPSPAPATPAWMSGVAGGSPPPAAPTTQMVPGPPKPNLDMQAFQNELDAAGPAARKASDKVLPLPEDEVKPQRYAAIMNAGRQAFPRTDPIAASDWDAGNQRQGRMLTLAEQGFDAANAPTPAWLRALGGFGAGAGLGSKLGGTIGVPALGLGTGLAVARYAGPRSHALKADWLDNTSASMMDRLSSLGRAPVGALEAGVHDYMNGPADVPEAPDPDALPADTTSSMNDQTGYPPGQTLGRATTAAMKANPDAFLPWAEDFNTAKSDDDRAAVVEGLVRRDPRFASALAAIQQQQDEYA